MRKLSAIAACSVVSVAAIGLPVRAQTRETIVEVPIYSPTSYTASLMQAELLVEGIIQQQFLQDASLPSVQIVVVGTRYGEVIPMMTTSVSRSQWQQQPAVAQWTAYNSTAQMLFARFEEQENDRRAIAAVPASIPATTFPGVDPVFQVEKALEQGRISRQEYDALVDALD